MELREGRGRQGAEGGELWDAEEMFKLVACFNLPRVFRWMNVEAFVSGEETRGEFLVLLGGRSW